MAQLTGKSTELVFQGIYRLEAIAIRLSNGLHFFFLF